MASLTFDPSLPLLTANPAVQEQLRAEVKTAAVLGLAFLGLTGGALYHGNLFWIIKSPDSFQWVNSLLGGESSTRLWHVLLMWYFIIFVLVHMYLALSISLINRDRTFTSIFTGYKLKKH